MLFFAREVNCWCTTHEWFALLDRGLEVGSVFFDLTKAFDSVPHWQLLSKLEETGLNTYLIHWIADSLTGRTQSVVLIVTAATCCVWCPSWLCLGTLLFLTYVNDMNDAGISDGSKLILYADDVLLYRAIRCQIDYTALQHDVDVLAAWASRKLLTFNTKKCYSPVNGQGRQCLINYS